MLYSLVYLTELYQKGVLGPGRTIDCPLDLSEYGNEHLAELFVKMVAYRSDGRGNPHPFGEDIAEGTIRAAKKWGRLDEDLASGLLPFPFWGLPVHKEPVGQLEWGYGTLLGDRDINEHAFDWMKHDAMRAKMAGREPTVEAEELVRIYTDKMIPFEGDRLMLDYSAENMYSEHIAKMVSWHRYYTRFWKQSTLFCDWRWPDLLNLYAPGKIGSTGEAEPKFLNAVTGKNITFRDGMELGRKIWNLDHAVWTLQGRHRDMVRFADYIYTRESEGIEGPVLFLPGRKNGNWDYYNMLGRRMDSAKFEEFKTRFYDLQGWETKTGYPKRGTLQSLGLSQVADELEKNGKLGTG
jgi:aldehyde:ferredoxin oxidoreductase